MRIVIDFQGAQTESRFRGIGRYTMSLTQAIIRNRGEHEIIIALSGLFPDTIEPIRAALDSLLPQENIHVWHALGPVRECEESNTWRREVAELIREAFLASLQPDVVYVTSLFEGYVDDAVTSIGVLDQQIPTVSTLYDLIPLLNPDIYLANNPGVAQYYQRKIEHLKRANQWLAISESSAREGIEVLELPTDAVINISTACDAVFRRLEITEDTKQQILGKFGITQPFILYSGGADARKNLKRMIRAYARLPKQLCNAYQLILAGKMPDNEVAALLQTAETAGISKGRLLFTGYVKDEELAKFYNLCTVFVFPSLHEGFGLPALEAMSCGTAVIGANTTSVPEVIGRQDALFDPYDETLISQKLAQVLEDAVFRNELATHGLEQARKFSWDKTARRAIAAFEKLHSDWVDSSKADKPKNRLRQLIDAIALLVPSNISDAEILKLANLLGRFYADNFPKQLLVDISELVRHDAKTGVQRVTRSILKELLESSPEGYVVEPVYATSDAAGYRYARRFTASFCGKACDQDDELLDYYSGDIFLGLDLLPHVIPAQKEYLASLRRDGVKVFFIVYDLLPVLMPHAFPPGTDIGHKAWLKTLLNFDGAICISRAVADELAEWQRVHYPQLVHSFKIGWFHLGGDVNNSVPTCGLPVDANYVLQELVRCPTFLIVGTVEPRKGHSQVLGAFELLWKQGVDVNLVIVGKQGWMVDSLAENLRQHCELDKHLFWLEGISDEYLEKIYAVSTCLIAASKGEGFGLPLIEAAQHKLPIIARDLPVFREVAREYAYFFTGTSPETLANAVRDWMALNTKGKTPLSCEIPRLTWAESCKQLMEVVLKKDMDHSSVTIAEETLGVNVKPAVAQTAGPRPIVLLLAPYPIRRPRHGGQLRTSAMLNVYEAAGFDVHSVGFYQEEAYDEADIGTYDLVFPSHSPSRQYQGEHIPALSDFMMGSFSISDKNVFRQILRGIVSDVQVIQIEQPWLYPLARRLQLESPQCRDSLLVFSSQNIEAPMKQGILSAQAGRAVSEQAIEEIDALEREVARQADLCLAVTTEDVEILRSYGAAKVLLAPNGIKPWVADMEKRELWRAKLPTRPWPIFIASAHPPNFTGFIAAVGDSLACIPPGSKLVIVGGVGPHLHHELSNSRWRDLNLSRLLVLGMLDDEDLAAVKSLAHAFLLPIGAGGGSNIKTAEALYSGKPVVCTSMALRGFEDYIALPEVTVADSPSSFQAAIRSVLGKAQGEQLVSGSSEMREQLTWEACLSAVPSAVLQMLTQRSAIR